MDRTRREREERLPSLDGGVQLPWDVGSPQHQNTGRVVPNTVNLHQLVLQATYLDEKLRLDTPARL